MKPRSLLKTIFWISLFLSVSLWAKPALPEFQTLYQHQHEVSRAQFFWSGKAILSVGYDKAIRYFSIAKKRSKVIYDTKHWIYRFAISPNQRWIAYTTSHKNYIRLFDLKTRKVKRILQGHISTVRGLAFHPSGKYLVSTADDQKLIQWDLQKGTEVMRKSIDNDYISHLLFNKKGNLLAAGMNTLYILQRGKYDIIHRYPIKMQVLDMALHPKHNIVLLTGNPMTNLGHNLTIIDLDKQSTHPQRLPTKILTSVAVSPDELLLATGDIEGNVEFFDYSSLQSYKKEKVHGKYVASVGFSPNNRDFFSASYDGVVKIWRREKAARK
ncbi:MAG: hypothetical protein AAF518_09655 [Spirochaetota bacterium]